MFKNKLLNSLSLKMPDNSNQAIANELTALKTSMQKNFAVERSREQERKSQWIQVSVTSLRP
jgi:hypothetical protein